MSKTIHGFGSTVYFIDRPGCEAMYIAADKCITEKFGMYAFETEGRVVALVHMCQGLVLLNEGDFEDWKWPTQEECP